MCHRRVAYIARLDSILSATHIQKLSRHTDPSKYRQVYVFVSRLCSRLKVALLTVVPAKAVLVYEAFRVSTYDYQEGSHNEGNGSRQDN